MRKLIDPNELEYMQIGTNAYVRAEDILSAPSVDAVPREIEQANKQAAYIMGYEDGQKDKYGRWINTIEVVQCKDCKHRPIGTNRDDLEFPDDKCPCKCEDYWYSWKPADDWFCGNGERMDGEEHE